MVDIPERFKICLFCWKKWNGLMLCIKQFVPLYQKAINKAKKEGGIPLYPSNWEGHVVKSWETCEDFELSESDKKLWK